jgi:predicted RecB family endonuclease
MGDMSIQTGGPPGNVSKEDAWAMLRESGRLIKEMTAETDRWIKETTAETDRQIKEMNAETDRQIKEMIAETDRQIKEMTAKTDRQMKETDWKIGKLGSRLGEIIEHIMTPKLHKKFLALGYRFNHTSRNHEIDDADKNRLTEIDILLENGQYALAVEVKTHLTTRDVRNHAKRMKILREVADDHGDTRKYLGAVAGAVIDREVADYALKNGFFVISPSGDTVDLTAPEGGGPRVW